MSQPLMIPSPKKHVEVLRADMSESAAGKGVDLVKHAVPYLKLLSDGSDETATIIGQVSLAGVYIIPPGTKFNKKTLLQSINENVVLWDFSKINNFSAPGETTKCVGIISSDTAEKDTHFEVLSGHHAVITMNNAGTSGTVSADERKASLLWACGYFENGAADKKGFRGAAIQQFTKDTGNSHWVWTIRSLAPWNAIQSDYEYWEQGEVIAGSGIYRSTGENHYVSASGGTTGSTMPVHTSGTVSDGGVSWTYVDSADRSVVQIDQFNRVLLGSSALDATFVQKANATDPLGGTYGFHGKATGVSKKAIMKLTPTNGSGDEQVQPYFEFESGVGFSIKRSDGTTFLAAFSDDGGFLHRKLRSQSSNAADGDTTPSVSVDAGTIYLSNTGATSITALDDGLDGQKIRLIATNGNTTIVHSTSLMLTGSINVTLTAFSSIDFEKVPNAISNRWIETGRSIK